MDQTQRERYIKYQQEYRKLHKSEKKSYNTDYYKKNKEKHNSDMKKWRAEHPDYYKEYYKKLKGDK